MLIYVVNELKMVNESICAIIFKNTISPAQNQMLALIDFLLCEFDKMVISSNLNIYNWSIC